MEWKYTKENPLRVVTLCSGYDSQLMAIRNLGIPYECVGWSEIDKYAIMAHNAVFPELKDKNLGDMTKIDWSTVPDFDLLFYSTPCFVAGTLILTKDGYKPIESISEGDYVLTHTNAFKKVTKAMRKHYNGDMVKIWGMGTDIIYCTEEHPFYVRRMYKKGHESDRSFHEPEWIKAKNLDKNCYVGYAINKESKLPSWGGTIDNRWGHGKEVDNLSEKFTNPAFWYLMGRYVGDGWQRASGGSYGIVICCSDRNKDSLIKAFESANIHYSMVEERTVYKAHVAWKELYEFVMRYGYKAGGKKVDIETMSLPIDLLEHFLNGYVDSDGYKVGDLIKTGSVSRELCFGIAQCVAKVYHRPFSIYRTSRKPTTVIEGRVVNQADSYSVTWKKEADKQDKAFYEDGYVWYPLSKLPIIAHDEVDVYNMSVEEDESYTANGAIVHNCTDLSTAGKQAGFEEGSGTRSSLLWYTRNAIIAKKPKYLVMENVRALVSDKFRPGFLKWCDELTSYGYTNFAQVLNAKDYGIPQNRERIFVVSILGDAWFTFPQPRELELRLRDMLEESVPEKYYLPQEKVDEFVNNLPEDKLQQLSNES